MLVAAISARALAHAAQRAGYRVLVADFFGDDDTREGADAWVRLPGSLRGGVDRGEVLAALQQLTAGAGAPGIDHDIEALIIGSGFERMPDIVDELAAHFPLAGSSAEAIRRVKDPRWLEQACAESGIPHPDIRFEPPGDPVNWLAKSIGGAGGMHVGAAAGSRLSEGRYFQRRVEGNSLSASFVAAQGRAHIVGFSRQWTSPAPDAPYRYGGAVRLRQVSAGVPARVESWLSHLVVGAGMVGLCSADFIRSRNGLTLIEINPRPGATLDIFDDADAPLLAAHIDACRGAEIRLPVQRDCAASVVAYTKAPIAAFPSMHWPDWTADRQSAGTDLATGDPLCTVFGRGASADAARRQAETRLARLEAEWERR